ncbi:hypothetical protein [Thermophilibacter sp.]|uniref:hypothetical protein n=1 Tax=Thermophilibacter sp. TaxID=2847309 RepID=UPI003A937099
MAGWTNNDRPPVPQGAVGAARGERGIVPCPQDEHRGEKNGVPSLPAGMFFCALGGAVASSALSFVGPAFVGYGYLSVAPAGGLRARVACAVAALVPAVALSLSSGVSVTLAAVVACLVVLAVCELTAARRLTPGAVCAVVGVAALALIGADELAARASGTTLAAGMDALLDAYRQELGALVGAAGQVQAVLSVVGLLWPVAYVIAAAASCASASLGALVAARRSGGALARPPRLAEFDLPLWVVAVFVASVAGIALALSVDGPVSQVALAVSANVAMSVRFALAVQGLAVLSWVVRDKGLGPVGSALAAAVALYLEVQFVVLTIAGLVDVWANFRHLARGGAPDVADQSMQD